MYKSKKYKKIVYHKALAFWRFLSSYQTEILKSSMYVDGSPESHSWILFQKLELAIWPIFFSCSKILHNCFIIIFFYFLSLWIEKGV